jgi:predicted TIM-barrel fold metal-dependent hydrolase
MFERYPNFFVDIAWVHLQLGRQPRAARQLFVRHPDRILFGSDVFPLRQGLLRVLFRFLETADEYFSYTDEPVHGSGRWNIYGLDLPRDVLEKVYSTNAKALLGERVAKPAFAQNQ